MDPAAFTAQPIMGILRGIKPEQLDPLLETVIASGLKTLEITMNTPGADSLIRQAVRFAGSQLTLGAGTVLHMDALHAALDAGASFIVTPIMADDVVAYCVENEIPVFPGALTPQEIYLAWQAGATMVKVFPSKFFGPDYFKEVKGPFQSIRLLACGGITPENLPLYRRNGADGFAVGGSIFSSDRLSAGDYTAIGSDLRRLVSACQISQ